ncbi:hypothetical protein [Limimonas halophila]|uniref:hypothetical protein n=1 Tax=Limimonas halophila TaxID=1082479 RepID=UPI00115FA053|nr:hypothetical protein [Limimonas halophila]
MILLYGELLYPEGLRMSRPALVPFEHGVPSLFRLGALCPAAAAAFGLVMAMATGWTRAQLYWPSRQVRRSPHLVDTP